MFFLFFGHFHKTNERWYSFSVEKSLCWHPSSVLFVKKGPFPPPIWSATYMPFHDIGTEGCTARSRFRATSPLTGMSRIEGHEVPVCRSNSLGSRLNLAGRGLCTFHQQIFAAFLGNFISDSFI
ncbi:hypothetical protein CEXT_772491 [Caerostris extrusa]|uniref:Uncharacterized protein n=1 Tax=Caerostris extrusa TaxID=172846 RepID=A0AAV4P504_CAEEX|nr:hypothetical protein CEXT_772491 [Caerostris extrusa]